MATYRNVQMSFWTDSKVLDDFTPEDKLFFLYIMTNPRTSLCGCYECSKKQMSRDTGYSVETISNIIYRMDEIHKVAKYNEATREVLILNWDKYNWTESSKVLDGAFKGAIKIKSKGFRWFVLKKLELRGYDVPQKLFDQIGYAYPMDKTVTFTDTDIESLVNYLSLSELDNNSDTTEEDKYTGSVEEVVGYLNAKIGTKYSPKSNATKEHIVARLKEGYTVADFKTVIDIKVNDWMGTSQAKFLRPTTLFIPSHFESYLNQQYTESTARAQGTTKKQQDMISAMQRAAERDRRREEGYEQQGIFPSD